MLAWLALAAAGLAQTAPSPTPAAVPAHTFAIGDKDFLLDGQPFQIRCGEIHFARVPREYWRQRLQMCRAMGLNTVCAYLFWNFHEWEPGKYDWAGQADAAEFCRIAQEEGLWVILRPGPYACAEWEGGGLPWWLLKNENIKLRSLDPAFMQPATAWLKEVGRVLGPQQITHGGPILMVQAENEYGSFGKDANYMGAIRQALLDAGFTVPLFACNPNADLRNGLRSDLFQVVNFGKNPQAGFRALRAVQSTGPVMCGEFYPGWFDTWGAEHHLGNTTQYLADLEYMLNQGASFSIYMVHGGTSFGMWPGADHPFKPDTNSYDYDAPISEAGWVTDKFTQTRALLAKHLAPGEKLPEPPAPYPVMAIAPFTLTQAAPLFDNLPIGTNDKLPRNMEAYNQGRGGILYQTTLMPGPETTFTAAAVRDFAWCFLDGQPIGTMDVRSKTASIKIPARARPAVLTILVEALGHVNYGQEMYNRKGIIGPVVITGQPAPDGPTQQDPWTVYPLPLDTTELSALKWKTAPAASSGPAFWRGTFNVDKPADTFLDLRTWGHGLVWVNGHCLSRFWNIGPTQTAYLPGPWLHAGANEVIVLDYTGPAKPVLAGLEKPILNELHPELDFSKKAN